MFHRNILRKAGKDIPDSVEVSGRSGLGLKLACQRGIPVMVKLQIGTTHELATVCSLPLIGNLYEKASFLRENHLEEFMGCWNFWNFNSANLFAFNEFLTAIPENKTRKKALLHFAYSFFPEANSEKLCRTWDSFAYAMEVFPFEVPFLYNGPVNHALGLFPCPGPLNGKTVGLSWLPTDSRGDDFRECLTATFPLDDVIERFHQIGVRWEEGLRQMEQAFGEKISESSQLELGNARICGAVWKSTEYLFRIYKLKKEWKDSFLPEYEQWKNEHLKNLENILAGLEKDPRQGFHLEEDFHSFSAERIRQILRSAQIK